MTRFLMVIAVCLALFIPPATVTASGANKPKIVVGGDHDNPPYEFIENGKPTGFNVEMIRAVAEVTGMEADIRLGPWNKARRDLEEGRTDALAGMYNTAERNSLVDFSVPHTFVTSGIFVRKGSPIRSLADLRGKEIIVQEGDAIHDYLRRTGLASRIIAVTDPGEELRLLASGKHDCALMPSRFQGEYFLRKFNLANIRVINAGLPQLRYCFAVRKGNGGLRYRLDEGLNILKISGRYRDIYEKWFGVYERTDLWEITRNYVVAALAVVAALLAAGFAWSWSLRRQVRIRTTELRESEEKFRVLAETTPAAIVVYQEDRLVYVNPAAVQAIGRTEQECLQMRFWDLAHDDFRELLRERGLARQRGEDVPKRYEYKWVAKSGEEKWALLSGARIEYGGKPAGIAMLIDITDRKRIEDELRRAYDELEKRVEERTAELAETVQKLLLSRFCIDKAAIGIYQTTFEGDIVGVNDFACRSLGYTADELRALKVSDIDPTITCEKMLEIKRMLDETGSAAHETVHRRKDGTTFPVEITANKLEFQGKSYTFSFVNDITERKRAEEALRDSEARLKMSMDLARLVQWEYDVKSGMFTFDDQFYALYGTTAEREGGTLMSAEDYVRKFVPPEESAMVAESIGRERESACFQMEHRIVRGDGEERVILVRSEVVLDEAGRVVKTRGANQDITERKLAEEMLRKSEMAQRKLACELSRNNKFLRTLIDAIPDLIFYKDCKRAYLGCNRAFEAFAGRTVKDLVGRTDLDIFSGDIAVQFREMDCQILSSEEARRTEEWIDYPDGRRVLLETLKTPFFDLDGEVLGVVGISRDITERKRMEEELRDSREKYQAIVDALDGHLYIASRDYRIQFMNERLSRLTGYREPGEFCFKVMHGRDSACPECSCEVVFDGRTTHREWFSPKDGRWYYVVYTPIFHADGSISRQAMATDITERKLAEEQLKRQKQQLEELNSNLEEMVQEEVAKNREKDIMLIQQNRQAALGELLDHIAHQWKQPLNSISLIVQNLWESYAYSELTADKIQETIDKTMALLEHMAQTIDVFRDFYRPDKKKTVFCIKESIDKVLAFVSPALKYQSIAVELDLDPGLLATGYPKQYTQVLLNILSNAREAFRERKTKEPMVKIRGFAEGNQAVVTIMDNAGGIPEAIIPRIFDLYVTTKEASGGTGIGLHMSKNIIEKNMHGSLTAENTDDGAQFRIAVNMPETGGFESCF
jgi:PAS domain S-box-containing protein